MRRTRKPIRGNDRRELRQFEDWLRRMDKQPVTTLTNPKWQEYMGLTPEEAWKLAQAKRRADSA